MPATSTISVACPLCGDPATVTLTSISPDSDEQVLDFACLHGHQVGGTEALRLWAAAHEHAGGEQGITTS